MIFRAATPDDMGFIVETFALTIRRLSTQVEGLPKERFDRMIHNLLANGWKAAVAEVEGFLLGWIAYRAANELAWFYVRDQERGKGVGKALLKWAGIDTTKTFVSPFLPNRGVRRFRINHRPFECVV